MTEILGSIATVMIVVVIAAAIIAICGSLKVPDAAEDGSAAGKEDARREDRDGIREQTRAVPGSVGNVYHPEEDAGRTTGGDDEEITAEGSGEQTRWWSFELLDENGRVKGVYPLPVNTRQGVTLGRSASNMIHISGYQDMSRRHLIIRSDDIGPYLIASCKCSSRIYVDGKLRFDGRAQDAAPADSKTYLRDGMMLRLGSARLRVRYS